MVDVERVMQEKDRLYLELRKVLERQPGSEVVEQITTYQRVSVEQSVSESFAFQPSAELKPEPVISKFAFVRFYCYLL